MNRLALALFFVPLAAAADAPSFSRGAMQFSLQFGTGLWALDAAHLASQVDPTFPGDSALFVADAQGGPTASLKLGYNIFGHATVGAEFTATGWDIFNSSRGGAGFLVGAVHWHPLELVWLKKDRPVPFDTSLFFGYGYGIGGSRRGMDGAVLEWGLDANYYFSKSFGLGIIVRDVILGWDKYYVDFDNKVFVNLPKGSGGSFWTFGVSLDFRFET